MATRTRRISGGAEFQCSFSHAAATSFPASSAAPIVMRGQNAPAKIAVRPSIEKVAHKQASDSAAMNAASLTGIMERRVTAVSGISVTLTASGTVGVTSVTVEATDVVAM